MNKIKIALLAAALGYMGSDVLTASSVNEVFNPVLCAKKGKGRAPAKKKEDTRHRSVSAVNVNGGSVTIVNRYGNEPTTYSVVAGTGAIGEVVTEIYVEGVKATLADVKTGMNVVNLEPGSKPNTLRKLNVEKKPAAKK